MSKRALRGLAFLGGAALLVALLPIAPAIGKRATPGLRRISTEPIMTMGPGAMVVPGGGLLVRSRDGVFATVHTSQLEEGTAVTAWFAIFQNPEHCATDPCTAADITNPDVQGSILNMGGAVIDIDGAATIGGFRAVGDASSAGGPPGTPNVGLLDPFKAEIHLAIRTHGVASMDPAVLDAQLSTFNGGCPPNTCQNLQASVHQP